MVSDSSTNSNSSSEENTKKKNYFFKNINLSRIPIINTDSEINGINPFEKDLSFCQRDKYKYELGYFLKKEYNNLFKEEWIRFKTISDKDSITDHKKTWDNIVPKYLFKDLNLDLHLKTVEILSDVFSKIIDLINYGKPEYIINKKIKSLTGSFYIFNQIKKDFENKFFVDLDYSSYIYDEETKL